MAVFCETQAMRARKIRAGATSALFRPVAAPVAGAKKSGRGGNDARVLGGGKPGAQTGRCGPQAAGAKSGGGGFFKPGGMSSLRLSYGFSKEYSDNKSRSSKNQALFSIFFAFFRRRRLRRGGKRLSRLYFRRSCVPPAAFLKVDA